jgi:CBS domain-containing protein
MSERTVFQSLSQRHVISIGPNASLYDAACVMSRANCGSVLIIDDSNTLLGILTERDLMIRVMAKGLDPKTTMTSAVMTRGPSVVPPETKVADAVLIMIERGFRHLPVVSHEGKILGVFSSRDALPREVNAAVDLAEFNEQVNDPLS